MSGYRLGMDVGGTNTDAVVMDRDMNILGAAKYPTTPDIATGIFESMDRALSQSSVDPGEIECVMVGTTQCLDALEQRKRLARVGAIRIGLPCSVEVPPFTDWPWDLKAACEGGWAVVRGGFEYDGRPIADLDEAALGRALSEFKRKGLESIAITCVFSPVATAHERRAAEMVKRAFGPDFPVTLSHEIGSMGLIERENSALLNAALVKVADLAAGGLKRALLERGIAASCYFTQNDGSAMSLSCATKYPVLTIGSGAANSIKGAGFLSGLRDCIVIDVGGTSTYVGVLVKGCLRESVGATRIAGVRTNFRIPDVVSLNLGGGSVVSIDGVRARILDDSVGYELTRSALAWGGDTFTLTDAALALGKLAVKDPMCDRRRLDGIDTTLCRKALALVQKRIEDAIELVREGNQHAVAVLVGGASDMLPEYLSGVSEVYRPPHREYANAVGAAIARVSGQVDRLWVYGESQREETLRIVVAKAVEQAIKAGAAPGTVNVTEIEETPLSYLSENAVRVKVKASGEPS